MMNVVVLIGRLANDPELKYTPSGVAVASFRLAVDRRPTSEGVREADFINIVAWRQSAEFAANYLTKGRLVAIEGRLQVRSWVGQDGSKRFTAEVVANQVKGLDKPKEQAAAVPAAVDEATPAAEPAEAEPADFDPFAEE